MELLVLLFLTIIDIAFYAKTPIDFRTKNKWYLMPGGGIWAFCVYHKKYKNDKMGQ